MLAKIPLIDRYLIRQLMPIWWLSITLCSVVAEIIGISFEQVRLITERDFPLFKVFLVHLLKFPAFFSLSLPFSLLMATLITYSKLAENNEIVALRSCGVSLGRLITPALILSLSLVLGMFGLNTTLIPSANYQAAIIIENEFKIERSNLQKYHRQNIIYQEFTAGERSRSLKYLIIADRFDGEKLHDVTVLTYQQRLLHQVIVANSALWHDHLKTWIFTSGDRQIIEHQLQQSRSHPFQQLTLPISKNLLLYVQNQRDNREMNLRELYQWLNVLQGSNDQEKILQVQINIQERYALPFSCLVFTCLGGILGCNHPNKINRFSVAIAIIICYQGIQFLCTSLSVTGAIPPIGIWLPNLIGLVVAGIFWGLKPRIT